MKKSIKRVALLVLAMTMLLGMSITASAKTKKISPKNQSFTTATKTASKKATTIKKGTYEITPPSKGRFYVKFKAPSTKKYSFTISNIVPKATGSYAYTNGYFYISKVYAKNNKYIFSTKAKTEGGTTTTFWYSSKDNGYGKKLTRPLPKRTAKVKINKGETVYLYFNTDAKAVTFTVK